MLCGRCCVTEPPTKLALRLDIFIEILLGTSENRGRPFTTGSRYRHLIKNDAICLVLVLS